jgi:hypothetical protein
MADKKTAKKSTTSKKPRNVATVEQMSAQVSAVQPHVPAKTNSTSSVDVQKWIEVAAYYRAERRGFQGGDPTDDWYQAEREIQSKLAEQTAHA